MPKHPQRGEVYLADLDPVVGHEQSGSKRPFLVLSIRQMNSAEAALTIGVPLTTTNWSSVLHVRIEPGVSGLERVSFAMPEMVRSVSTARFRGRLGRVPLGLADTAAAHTSFLIGLGEIRV